MLILNGRVSEPTEGELTCALDGYAACWVGLPYWPGIPPGEASVRRLLARIKDVGVIDAAPELCGHYFIAVVHEPTGRVHAFVDGCALQNAFWSTGAIGTSFLELARSLDLRSHDMDFDALVEFLNLGAVYFGRTFFPGIRKISRDDILKVSPGGRVQVLRKPTSDLGELPRTDFASFFAELAAAFKDEPCSIDLTGGIDSRLVAVLLTHFGLDFETTISGVEGNADIAISREVASILGKDHYVTYHRIERLEDELPSLFRRSDGLMDILNLHRMEQHNRARAARGVTVAFSGVGGELYKDFFWLQDFPFYNRKRPNLRRLFDYRTRPIPFPRDCLAAPCRPMAEQVRPRILAGWQQFVDSCNTRTYDRVYYYSKNLGTASQFISSLSPMVRHYAPLCEPDLVRTGFHQPRRMRFFNRFHRRLITKYCPSIATVPTTEKGMSVSENLGDQLRDSVRFVSNKFVRLAKKVIQRTTHKTYFQESPDHPKLRTEPMHYATTHDLVARLEAAGVLAKGTDVARIGPTHIGKVLTLGLLLDYLDEP